MMFSLLRSSLLAGNFLVSSFLVLLMASGSIAEAHEGKSPSALEADMVFIPAGPYVFGTDKTDPEGRALELGVPKPLYVDEHPRQQMLSKGFYMDRHEVTNRRYKAFLDALNYFQPAHWKENGYPKGQPDHPVVWVNWFDAANFCDWAGKRLPTEKEWERAARGKEGWQYPWGDEFKATAANLSDKAGSKTELAAAGSFPEGDSPEGVQDLIGNVWEWTADDYAPYKGNSQKNADFDSGFKVLRGQSASYIGHFPGKTYDLILKEFARSGYRQYSNPDQGGPDVGFRCVSDSKPAGFQDTVPQAGTLAQAGGEGGLFSGGTGASVASSSDTGSAGTKPVAASASPGFNPFQPQSNLPTESGMVMLVLLSFIAGLFSFLSPCTLPILPAYFAVTAQTDRARMTFNSLAFFCGLAALFVLMGGSASFLGSLLRDYLNELTVICGVLVVLFGVMTLIGKGFSGANFRTKPATTLVGYFFFGATFALGWTPCVGPVLSGILILAASDRTIFQGMTLLFFFALGLGLPLVVIAAFCSQLSKDSWFWRLLRGKAWTVDIGGKPVILHSTNLASGVLLILLGVALAEGYLTYFNNWIPLELQIWFSGLEEKVIHWFS